MRFRPPQPRTWGRGPAAPPETPPRTAVFMRRCRAKAPPSRKIASRPTAAANLGAVPERASPWPECLGHSWPHASFGGFFALSVSRLAKPPQYCLSSPHHETIQQARKGPQRPNQPRTLLRIRLLRHGGIFRANRLHWLWQVDGNG